MTKYIICLGDGMADHPIKALHNKTPLETAHTPNIDSISSQGYLGLADTVPQGFSPGSDVANMGILGYDPAKYYTGRGPIEAASLNISLNERELIFRCNLVTVSNNHLVDFTSEHISTEESAQLINELNTHFNNKGVRFIAGVSYRHIMVVDEKYAELNTIAPHDIIDQPITTHLPHGPNQNPFLAIINQANTIIENSPINKKRIQANKKPANHIWPWSQGKYPSMPPFKEKYGLTGGIVTAVDLLKGLGVLTQLETPDVPGATGFIDTNYANKMKAALKLLEHHDFCYLHIEAPDEAGHMGDSQLKIKAIEDFDKHIVGPTLDYQKQHPDTVIMVLPDHPTPCDIKTHTHEPIPFCYYYPNYPTPSTYTYTEKNAKKTQQYIHSPWALLQQFLNQPETNTPVSDS